MTDTRIAFAHREPLMVPAPDGVNDAISAVMAAHRAELDEALAPFGVSLDDLLQPTWMRVVRMSDVEPINSVEMTADGPPLKIGLDPEATYDIMINGEKFPPLKPYSFGPTNTPTGTRADVADLPPCDCGSVDKNGDDLGEHDPTCPYHLEAVRRWGLTVLPGDEPRPTDLEGD